MKQEHDERRSFLKHLLAGSTVVAGTALATRSAKARSRAEVQRPEETLYQETDAFKRYYDSLR